MVVEATCADCGDVHPVGDRVLDGVTTECPACGSTRYSSTSTAGRIRKSEAARIADAVRGVAGVGEHTLAHIQAEFSTYAELERADRDRLMEIEGVGKMSSEGILERV